MWVSGRKLRVVGRLASDASISVPVSAMPAKAGVTETGSSPWDRPRWIVRRGRSAQGNASSEVSGDITISPGRL